ncbi:probable protein phosphatase 2C 4 [Zingiber officinale]|uniref:probable protein phosphatase 2C 4 n=1 Tax=Zingiber officinale TaxID=94328 RepID=UPI001C4B5A92|nr:probable protein phosphatase 2C 4 [Zingiber officinale]
MGNRLARLAICCSGGGGPPAGRRHKGATVTWDPCDEGLGHSFCYVRPDAVPGGSGPCSVAGAAAAVASSKVYSSEETTMFRSISGAAVSANASTPLSTALLSAAPTAASAFESSTSFSSVALQPVPRLSGPLSGPLSVADRGFMSGPIERGFLSGPLDPRFAVFSGPIEKPFPVSSDLRRSVSHSLSRPSRHAAAARSLLRELTKVISKTISSPAHGQGFLVAAVKGRKDSTLLGGGSKSTTLDTAAQWSDTPDSVDGNIQWAQGKAGEDRVHVVVSEEHGWVFVGIYDGFNGPDATDFLLSNLYATIHRELKGLLWDEKGETFPSEEPLIDQIPLPLPAGSSNSTSTVQNAADQSRRRCKREFDVDCSDLERRPKEQLYSANHSQVLEALRRALEKTEDSFLGIADKMVADNPELALMGSCVLVMLMKDDNVYLMNVGDSRAVLAHKTWHEHGRINELHKNSTALQLTSDHSTSIEEEVQRIRKEHPDDASAISNGRVKRTLKVTRAFGAGFLKQPKWNNALLEMFRIEYVGNSPYITCNPFLHHHKLSPKDRFLILSSDGLYQYFTNEDAVAQVETFIATTPGGDPAQHLVEEALFRAAKKAGMNFHELFEIEQGDRRRYHDDISIIIISLEGQIWRSCM